MEAAFWISIAAVAYFYVGFPALLAALTFFIRRPCRKHPIEPTVSILVAAYNEADSIAEKIRNALDLDYPANKLEIVIASDGWRDATAEIARQFTGDPRVRVFEYAVNRGKITALNETVPHLGGEIVAFTDATSMLAPGALRELVANFADPAVGAVSGVYRIRRKEAAQLGPRRIFTGGTRLPSRLRRPRWARSWGHTARCTPFAKRYIPFPCRERSTTTA